MSSNPWIRIQIPLPPPPLPEIHFAVFSSHGTFMSVRPRERQAAFDPGRTFRAPTATMTEPRDERPVPCDSKPHSPHTWLEELAPTLKVGEPVPRSGTE